MQGGAYVLVTQIQNASEALVLQYTQRKLLFTASNITKAVSILQCKAKNFSV